MAATTRSYAITDKAGPSLVARYNIIYPECGQEDLFKRYEGHQLGRPYAGSMQEG